MSVLLKALMVQNDCNVKEARALLDDMKAQVAEGNDPDEVLHEQGLGPDYILDLI